MNWLNQPLKTHIEITANAGKTEQPLCDRALIALASRPVPATASEPDDRISPAANVIPFPTKEAQAGRYDMAVWVAHGIAQADLAT